MLTLPGPATDVRGSHSDEYTAEWLPDEERDARWSALGLTLDDF